MTLPIELNNKSWYFVLDKKSTDDFISEINITKEDIKNNKLFLRSHTFLCNSNTNSRRKLKSK